MPKNTTLTLPQLTAKCVMLFLLASARRLIDIANLTLDCFHNNGQAITFVIPHACKTYKKQYYMNQKMCLECHSEENMCPVQAIRTYIMCTARIRTTKTLFIITKSPYSAATVATVSRWAAGVLKDTGVDMSLFSPHTTRAASVSKTAATTFQPASMPEKRTLD